MNTYPIESKDMRMSHKMKARKLAAKMAPTFANAHRIEFNVRNNHTAVLLNDEQFETAKRKAFKKGITLQELYEKKYSKNILSFVKSKEDELSED